MRKIIMLSLSVMLLALNADVDAQSRRSSKSPVKRSTKPAVKSSSGNSRASTSRNQLSDALNLVRDQKYERAAVMLYNLSRRSDLEAERTQIKYILVVSLLELKLYQVAAFQFVDVVRKERSRYTQQAIEKLMIAADALGDDSLLNYAISKVQLNEFPAQYKDLIYYRLGEVKLNNGKFAEAADLFSRVTAESRHAYQARFNRGLAYLESKQPQYAIRVFQSLIQQTASFAVTDSRRVAAQLGLARSLYQNQNWDESVEAYRAVPRDHVMWHDALFEMSWALLRSAKFRSVLSNFQSLHSTFYEEFYMPETLLLRGIVYLYICKYDEMEKVLGMFQKAYGPVRTKLGQFMQAYNDPNQYYREIENAVDVRNGKKDAKTLRIPYSIARYIMDQGDVKRGLSYLRVIEDELRRWNSSQVLVNTSLSTYAKKILFRRVKNTRITSGERIRVHMVNVRAELRDLYEQAEFARYEMINGKKEQLKKKIAGKSVDDQQIDEEVKRDFYIQNGYEYWPFEGEYWLDEIGNYQYLGKQSCE